ncbi:AraC-like DNA-binding protein [Rhizobium aquaticum]|uniref:AraC-like DNA-binding protein n=1 Tax=Rhizobium aquaticum TaxID=1549636 RepID=A0ABV2IY26_9HYPH
MATDEFKLNGMVMDAWHNVNTHKPLPAGVLQSNGILMSHMSGEETSTWQRVKTRAREGSLAYGVSVRLCASGNVGPTGKIRIDDWSGATPGATSLIPNSAHFEIPHNALFDFAHGKARPDYHGLACARDGVDLVLLGLSQALLPSLRHPETADRTFVANICQAILTHLVEKYGGIYFASKSKGCLAPWQERKAAEFLVAHLEEPFSLVELANVCELSRSYFIKAFKESFGKTPHRWLMDYRIGRSKRMLQNEASLAEIALACGFSDQSHMTRVFVEYTGISPGRYRRLHVGDQRMERA